MEAEYDRRHAEIWPEVAAAITAAGIRTFSLFRRGRSVVSYLECNPDAATALGRLDADPVSSQWDASMTNVLEDSEAERYDEVWHLS